MNKEIKKNWEERWHFQYPLTRGMKSFIEKAIQQERERIIETVERKINPKIKNDGDEGWSDFSGSWDEFNEAIGYNQALVDLKKELIIIL